MFKYIKKNIFFNINFLYISILHFILTFFTDRFIFEYFSKTEPITPISVIIKTKLLFLIFLIILWQIIAYVIKNYKTNIDIRNTIKFASIYFVVMMILEICFFPLLFADQMYFTYLYDTTTLVDNGAFSGYFICYIRIFSMMLIPNFSGIIITQILIISLIIGYIIQKLNKYYNYSNITYLLYVIFFLPNAIIYTCFIEKDILYTYAIILLIVKLIFIKLENNFSKKNLFFIALNTSVIAALRPDGITFLIFPIFYFFIIYKNIKIKKFFLFIFFLILTSCIFYPNYIDTTLLDKNGNSYAKSYILNNTFKVLLGKAVSENNTNILNNFNHSEALTYKYLLSENCKLTNGFYVDLSQKDKEIFDNISKNLILQYKKIYLYTKMNYLFNLWHSPIFNTNFSDNIDNDYTLSVFNKMKNKIKFINIRLYDESINKIYFFQTKTYNLIIQIILLFILFIISLKKKNFYFCYIVFFILSYTITLTILCPLPLFRYYFYLYYLGYLLPLIFLLKLIVIKIKNLRKVYEEY